MSLVYRVKGGERIVHKLHYSPFCTETEDRAAWFYSLILADVSQ